MIRRVVSVLLFVFGGWMLASELAVAFFNMEPGLRDSAILIGIFVPVAGIPLLCGVWASPGDRWRELGLTLLIAAGVMLFCAITMLAFFLDPGFKPYMPPMPKIEFAPIIGIVNLLVIAALGWLLYRRPSHHAD